MDWIVWISVKQHFILIWKTLLCNSQTLSLGAYKMKLVMWLQNETFSVQ